MSYILDALKRADAERSRGGIPTLHSQAVPVAAAAPSRMPRANVIAALAAGLLAVAAVLWWALGRQPSPVPVAVQIPAAVQTPLPTQSVPPPVVAAAPVEPAPATTPAARPPKPETPRKTAEPPRAIAARPAASATAAASAGASSAPTAPAPIATAQDVVYKVSELPDDIRTQLPALAITGATYSTQAAYRMLIVNGQVLHENDAPAPGLTLESIRQKDVVLRFKGYRYSVGY